MSLATSELTPTLMFVRSYYFHCPYIVSILHSWVLSLYYEALVAELPSSLSLVAGFLHHEEYVVEPGYH